MEWSDWSACTLVDPLAQCGAGTQTRVPVVEFKNGCKAPVDLPAAESRGCTKECSPDNSSSSSVENEDEHEDEDEHAH